ncbi:MAG: hypothetical protein ACLFUN_10150, partial [Desulfobacterales bacterium]
MTEGRLIIAIDDYINPKTGRKIFACDKVFDHAAKINQSKYSWAQNIVTIGLLKVIKGRWRACRSTTVSTISKKALRRSTSA